MDDKHQIWIKIETGTYCNLHDLDVFKSNLRQYYPVQAKTHWRPAACSGFEMVFGLMINHPIAWLTGVVVSGLAWDIMKAGCSYMFNQLDLFCKKNDNVVYFEAFEIEFDDITIRLIGIEGSPITILSKTINQLSEALNQFAREGINQIYSIELPFYKESDSESQYSYCADSPDDPIWWKVYYDTNERLYYCPSLHLFDFSSILPEI